MAVPMANGPPFATLNHVAADLGIPNESEPLRVGISAFTRVFDALWRYAGNSPPDVAALIRATTSYRSSRLERLQRRRGARPQEAHVAADGEEAHPALGERNGTLSRVAIGAHHLARLGRRRRDAVEFAVDLARHGIDIGALAERDREVRRPEEKRVDPRRRGDGFDVVERRSGLDHGEGDGEVIGLAQVNLLVRHIGERGGAVM